MAEEEVGKIEINGTIYPIKDETSRTLTEGQYKTTQQKVEIPSFTYTVRNTSRQKIYTMPHPKGMFGYLSILGTALPSGTTISYEIIVGGIEVGERKSSPNPGLQKQLIYATEDTPIEIYAYKSGASNPVLTISAEYLQLNSNA